MKLIIAGSRTINPSVKDIADIVFDNRIPITEYLRLLSIKECFLQLIYLKIHHGKDLTVRWKLMNGSQKMKKTDYKKIKEVLKHPDKLGAGARKREALPSKLRGTAVMKEFAKGTLHSGSGEKVTNPAQAKAIAVSESKEKK